jgi:hypothetical protein
VEDKEDDKEIKISLSARINKRKSLVPLNGVQSNRSKPSKASQSAKDKHVLSNAELADMYSNAIKLSTENVCDFS